MGNSSLQTYHYTMKGVWSLPLISETSLCNRWRPLHKPRNQSNPRVWQASPNEYFYIILPRSENLEYKVEETSQEPENQVSCKNVSPILSEAIPIMSQQQVWTRKSLVS